MSAVESIARFRVSRGVASSFKMVGVGGQGGFLANFRLELLGLTFFRVGQKWGGGLVTRHVKLV